MASTAVVEHHRHTQKAGLVTQSDGQMGFSQSDATEQNHIAFSLYEVESEPVNSG
jgi:hypothetical protein